MRKLHLVSHTHWDREWYRTFQQFRLRLVHLIDSVLDLLDKDRNFKYFMLDGQTIVLEDYLTMRPENENRLRRYIQNGRLAIGPFHILPDEFLVSPEATVRNLLEGDRTCRRFGAKMQVGYIPDPFGHIGQLPQILKGFDIHTACVQRGLSDEGCEFWWEAPDGSHVFMAYLRDGYGNAAGLPTKEPKHFTAEVKRLRDSLLPHSSSGHHLLLMHGTDHMEPPPETSTAIATTRGHLEGDELVHSTLSRYLKDVQASLRQKTLATVRGELRDCKRSHLLPGVLSTRMWIKQRNRACETLLEKWAEPFSTFAAQMEAVDNKGDIIRQPTEILHQAWRLLMECHPHDSICGCSIDQVHDEMKARFDQVEQIGEEITRQSLHKITRAVNTDSGQVENACQALVVFNPHSFLRSDSVEATVEWESGFDLVDENGTPVPYQGKGLGAQELIHANLTSKELQSMYTAVHDGQVMGLAVLDIKIDRKGDTVLLEAAVSEDQPANMQVWQSRVAEIEALIADPEVKSFRVRAISSDSTRITFTAQDVPGLGWKTYFVQPRSQDEKKAIQLPRLARLLLPLTKLPVLQKILSRRKPIKRPHRIENNLLIVQVERDGSLTVTDKATGRIWRGMNRFRDGGDCGDEYNYCPPQHDQIVEQRLKNVFIEGGNEQQSVIMEMELPAPAALTLNRRERSVKKTPIQITSRATIHRGVNRIDIHTTVNNHVLDHRLRVHFEAPFSVETAEHDGHYEVVERSIKLPEFDHTWVEQPRPEVPQRTFTSIYTVGQRLTIANRGLPEVEVLKTGNGTSEIAVTLLRCVGWLSRDDFANRKGHAGPFVETPGAQLQGKWDFHYAIVLEQDALTAYQQSYAFETPLQAVDVNLHHGILPPKGSFLQVTPGEFLVSAIKEAGNGKGWVARGYNLGGKKLQVMLKTGLPAKAAAPVNLLEQRSKNIRPTKGGKVTLPINGHEIVSVLFERGTDLSIIKNK